MSREHASGVAPWPRGPWAPLLLSAAGLAGGGVAVALGAETTANGLWIAVAVLGAAVCARAIVAALRHGRLGVDVIAVLALAGAVGVREYLAGAVIGVMLATGQGLERWAEGRATSALTSLLAHAPQSARRREGTGLTTVNIDEVAPGDLLVIASGEVVPVDGRVATGPATLDESALTGESNPVEHFVGDEVRSGVLNAGAGFELRATTRAADGTYAGVVRLVADAERSPARYVRQADRFSLYFLATTLALAVGAWLWGGAGRAVAVLVVATPCPLILAAPIAQVAGLSRAARRGVIIKGGAVLERLASCTTMLIDKTGTLTIGRPELTEIATAGGAPADDVLTLAASLDQVSPHVLASAVVRSALARGCTLETPSKVEEVPGQGIRGWVGGHHVAVGSSAWTGITGVPDWSRAAHRRARLDGALTVFVSVDGVARGILVFRDPLRPDAARTIRTLRRGGIDRIVLVTGDRTEVAETIGAVIGVDEVLAQRSPEEKLDVVRLEARLAPTMMVGDGINDAPALAVAQVGVALGARGATAASEAAGVVLTVDRLDRLGEAAVLARRTRRIAMQSMTVGIGLSLGAMGVAAAGYLPAVGGALLQEAIDIAVIVNALRAIRGGRGEAHLTFEDSALTRRFRDEHHSIRATIERIHLVAATLGTLNAAAAIFAARDLHRQLVAEVLPHERAEEEILYPVLGRFLGGHDPMGPMSRAHVEIAHQIRRLGQLLDEIDPTGADDAEITELRGLLYGLHAILDLHTAQEDESYLSLGDESGAPPVTASVSVR